MCVCVRNKIHCFHYHEIAGSLFPKMKVDYDVSASENESN